MQDGGWKGSASAPSMAVTRFPRRIPHGSTALGGPNEGVLEPWDLDHRRADGSSPGLRATRGVAFRVQRVGSI